jgi:hypothetical protein
MSDQSLFSVTQPKRARSFFRKQIRRRAVAACAVASTLWRNISCCRNIWTSVLPFFGVTRVGLTIDSLQITADSLSSVQRPYAGRGDD